MKSVSALVGGLAGACSVTLLHESIRRIDPAAPRIDLLGRQAISKTLKSVGAKVPEEDSLFNSTIGGDLLSNAMYYSLAGTGKKRKVWIRGALLGLSAGLSAVLFPKPVGLNETAANHAIKTKCMTLGLYLVGGLVAAATIKLLQKNNPKFELTDFEE